MVFPVVLVISLAAGLAAAALVLLLRRRRTSGLRSAPAAAGWTRLLGVPAAAFVVTALIVGAALTVFTDNGGRPEARLLETIRHHHPEAGPEIDAILAERDPLAAQNKSAALAQRYFPRHLATTSDAAILRFTGEMTAIFEGLLQRDAQSCKALAGGGSLGAGLDPNGLQRALDAMADVIVDSVEASQPPPDRARAQTLLSEVVTKVYAGKDQRLLPPQALAQPQSAAAEPLCRTMIAFYRAILALPPKDGSTVLRVLMQGSRPAAQ